LISAVRVESRHRSALLRARASKLVAALNLWHRSAMWKNGRKLPPVRSHEWLDLVDLAMHRAIVRKIRRKPKLYGRARRTLARWESVGRACAPNLSEWKEILSKNDMSTVLRILVRMDNEGQRLRSTAPFTGILTPGEVEAIWARYDKKSVGRPLAARR
jgi:hypothetical protein